MYLFFVYMFLLSFLMEELLKDRQNFEFTQNDIAYSTVDHPGDNNKTG